MSKVKSRMSNSIRNSGFSILYNCVTILVTFIAQSIFIKMLGAEYNGVKSLFQNILTMLSFVELGFGTAIVYNLYKPIYNDNENEIKSIILFYKKVYRTIAFIILTLGIVLTFFIPYIVGNNSIKENIYFIFLLYLFNAVISYFLSYKTSILYADQKNYVINIVNLIFNIIKNIVQILILLYTKNFILFLVIQIITTILSNLTICLIVNKKYPYLRKLNRAEKLSKNVKESIIQKVKGLIFHKVGEVFVTGTDNILISVSKNLGIVYVGYYANYNMIISNVSIVFGNLIGSVTSSVGNLLVETKDDKNKRLQTYQSMLLINSWIFCFGMTAIYCLIGPFIKVWIGSEYILSTFVLTVLVINFYLNGIKRTSNTFKEAAGIFYEDRFIPIIESIVNIVFSIIFMNIFGLAGVFLGTICSSFVLLFYGYPKYVYKKVFEDKIVNYFKIHGYYFGLSLIAFLVTIIITSKISMESTVIEMIIKGIICLIIPNLIYLALVIKNKDFVFLVNMLKNKFIRKGKKKNDEL